MTYVSFRRLKRRAGVPAMNFQSLFLEEKALNLHKIPPWFDKITSVKCENLYMGIAIT